MSVTSPRGVLIDLRLPALRGLDTVPHGTDDNGIDISLYT